MSHSTGRTICAWSPQFAICTRTAEHTGKLIGTTDRLKELTDAIMTVALMSLVLAVNAEFGLGKTA